MFERGIVSSPIGRCSENLYTEKELTLNQPNSILLYEQLSIIFQELSIALRGYSS